MVAPPCALCRDRRTGICRLCSFVSQASGGALFLGTFHSIAGFGCCLPRYFSPSCRIWMLSSSVLFIQFPVSGALFLGTFHSIAGFGCCLPRYFSPSCFVVTPVAVRRRRIGRRSLSLSSVVFVRILVLWSPLLLSAGAESVGTASSCSYPRFVVTLVAVHRRRISRHASGKQLLSAVPPTIYHSGVLSRKQVISNSSLPQASQNPSY